MVAGWCGGAGGLQPQQKKKGRKGPLPVIQIGVRRPDKPGTALNSRCTQSAISATAR